MILTNLPFSMRAVQKSDMYLGLGAIGLGIIVLVYSLSLPTLGGGMPGPGLFPGIISVGFILLGLSLIVRGLLLARKSSAVDPAEPDEQRQLVISQGTRLEDYESTAGPRESSIDGIAIEEESLSSRRVWMNGLVVLAAITGYMVLAEHLGFIITMFLVSLAIMFVLKAKVFSTIVTSFILSFGMWAIFERGLQVQLPDGLLW